MSTSEEPINFLSERRLRRPGEKEPAARRVPQSPLEQEPVPAPPPKPKPEPPPVAPKPEPKKGPRCSCCGLSGDKVKVFLDAGRGILLCGGCVEVCNEILHDEEITTEALPAKSDNTSSYRSRTKYHCSFCGKEQADVARLIAMLNNLFICNSCVGVCNTCIAQARSDASTEAEVK
jgi:hypothetical protein